MLSLHIAPIKPTFFINNLWPQVDSALIGVKEMLWFLIPVRVQISGQLLLQGIAHCGPLAISTKL